MKQKLVTILLLCAMLTIAGCSAPQAVVQSSPSPTAATVGTPAAAASPQAEPDATETGRLTEDNITYTVMLSEHASYKVNPDAPSYKAITEITGIGLDFMIIPASDYNNKKQTLIATDNIPDIIQANPSDLVNYGSSGVFLPLNQYIDEYGKHFPTVIERIPDIRKLAVDGELYAFPCVSRDDVIKTPLLIMRTDLLEKHDLKEPATYIELYETLKTLKELYPSSIPFCVRGTSQLGSILYSLGTMNDIYYDPDIDGGSYVFGPTREEYKEAMAYLNRLYSEDLLDPEYAVTTQQQWQEKFGKGDALFLYDNPNFVAAMSSTLSEIDETARLEMIPFPANSRGQQRVRQYSPHNYDREWVINAEIDDPVTAYRFMDWFYSDEACDLRSFGILDEHYTVEADGTRVFKPEVIAEKSASGDLYGNMQMDLGIALGNMTPYLDNTLLKITTSEQLAKWWFVDMADFSGKQLPVLDPPFTDAESKRIKDIRSALATLQSETIDKYITGALSLDEFESIADQYRALGSQELEQIYNEANKRVK